MKLALPLLKYAILLGALSICVYVLLVKYSFTNFMLYSVIGLSLAYFFIALIENFLSTKKTTPGHEHFVYYTPGMLTKKLIRIGGFAIASAILLFSGMKVLLFGLLLLAMLLTELAGLIISIRTNLYYVFFEDRAVVFQEDQLRKVFASHIQEIEFRYEIFYLTLKNNQVKLIETEKVESAKRTDFVKRFVEWANANQLPFTQEAQQKLNIIH